MIRNPQLFEVILKISDKNVDRRNNIMENANLFLCTSPSMETKLLTGTDTSELLELSQAEPVIIPVRSASDQLKAFIPDQTETLRNVNSYDVAMRIEETRHAIYSYLLEKRKVAKGGLEMVRKLNNSPYTLKAAQGMVSGALGILHDQLKEYLKLATKEKVYRSSPPRVDATGFRSHILRVENIEQQSVSRLSTVESIHLKDSSKPHADVTNIEWGDYGEATVLNGVQNVPTPTMETDTVTQTGPTDAQKLLLAMTERDFQFALIDVYGYEDAAKRKQLLKEYIESDVLPDAAVAKENAAEAVQKAVDTIDSHLAAIAKGPNPYHLDGGSMLPIGMLAETVPVPETDDDSALREWFKKRNSSKTEGVNDLPQGLTDLLQQDKAKDLGPDRINGFQGVLAVHYGDGEYEEVKMNTADYDAFKKRLAKMYDGRAVERQPVNIEAFDGGEVERMFRFLAPGGKQRVRLTMKYKNTPVDILKDEQGLLTLTGIDGKRPESLRTVKDLSVLANAIVADPSTYARFEDMRLIYAEEQA